MGRGGSRLTRDVPGPVPGGRAGTRWAGRWGGGRSHVDGGFDPPALAGGELGRGQGGAAGRSQGRGRQPRRPGCVLCPVPTRSRRGGSELGGLSSHAGRRGPVGFGHSGGPAGGRNGRGGEGVPEAAVTAAARLGGADVSPCRKPGRGRTCGCGSEAPFGGTEQGGCEDERCGVEISEVLPCLIVMEGFVFGRVSGRS